MEVNGLSKSKKRKIEASFILLTLAFFFILLGLMYVVVQERELSKETAELTVENTERIDEIQESRLEACERIYEGVREVFTPLFPPLPRPPDIQARLDLFNSTVDKLKTKCPETIRLKMEMKG